jgi:hypothetical protein
MTSKGESNAIGVFTGFIYFFFITIVYFFIKSGVISPSQSVGYTVAYIGLLLIGEFIINLNVTSMICGSYQYSTAAIVTFIPWTLFLGVLAAILIMFPGWISPFSNTFGYLAAKMSGINKVFNNILKSKSSEDRTAGIELKSMAETLEYIYRDKSLLINEITTKNFDTFWDRMMAARLFKPNAGEYKDKLHKLVRLKDTVGELVWYLLTGGLVTSVSFNYISGAKCKKSVSQLQKAIEKVSTSNEADTAPSRTYTQ